MHILVFIFPFCSFLIFEDSCKSLISEIDILNKDYYYENSEIIEHKNDDF